MRVPGFAQFRGELGKFCQIFLFGFQGLRCLFNQRAHVFHLQLLLLALAFRRCDFAFSARDQLRDFFGALAIELDAAAMRPNLTLETFDLGATVGDLRVELVQSVSSFREIAFAIVDLAPRRTLFLIDAFDLAAALRELVFELFQLFARMVRIEDLQIREQRLISPRLARLALQRTDLPFDLFNDVADAQQIRFSRFELAQRFALLRLIFCNPGRFFKNRAAIFRARAQDQIDLALLHHRVSAARDARVGKKILNVAQTAQRFVQKIFGVAVAINAARHAHIVPIDSELGRAIGQRERDFGETERLARVGPVENDIGHFAAAK